MKAKLSATKPSKVRGPIRDTFTVRDLNRQPQVVLTAAKKLGRVLVRSRSGDRFVLEPMAKDETDLTRRTDFLQRIESLHQQMRASGSDGFTAEGWATFSKAIAGE